MRDGTRTLRAQPNPIPPKQTPQSRMMPNTPAHRMASGAYCRACTLVDDGGLLLGSSGIVLDFDGEEYLFSHLDGEDVR